MDAGRTTAAELRHHRAVRSVLAQLARDPHAPATLVQLAAAPA